MKLTINTEKLKKLVAIATKGASNNKSLALTSLMWIHTNQGFLNFVTTDGINFLYTRDDFTYEEDLSVVVVADTFSKIISKTTSANVSIELVGTTLTIHGNGKYTMELPLDENGELVKFPNPAGESNATELVAQISKETLDVIKTSNKSAISKSKEESDKWYTGYYIYNFILTGDGLKICLTERDVCKTPLLLSGETVNLLEGAVDIYKDPNSLDLLILTKDFVVCTHAMEDIENYNATAILNIVNDELPYHCAINKHNLLAALDRVALFVSPYDLNAINLLFREKQFGITNAKSTSGEVISYEEADSHESFSCSIDADLLKSQVSTLNGETFELWYGSDSCIKMVDGDTTVVVALRSNA